MKLALLAIALSLPPEVYSAACPLAEMKRSGVLSEADAAKFEAVKRDPKAAEELLKAHQARDAMPNAEPEPQGGLLGGDLPLGGGLSNLPIDKTFTVTFHLIQ